MSRALSGKELSLAPGLALQPDDWLSEILGKRALRVVLDESSNHEGPLASQLADEPLFATAKVSVEDITLVTRLQDLGFRVVDTALTFELDRLAGCSTDGVRFSEEQDRDRVVDIAAHAFVYSRFHLDTMIPNQLADRVKAEWVANYFNGARGDAMVVADRGGAVAGFLLLLRGREGSMIIDLIAVDAKHVRRGLARAMVAYAATHGFGDGHAPTSIRVGTQAANTSSVRLYEDLGFRLCCAQYVLHYHGVGGQYLHSSEANNK